MPLTTVSAEYDQQEMMTADRCFTAGMNDYTDATERTLAIKRLCEFPSDAIELHDVIGLYLSQMDANPDLRPATKRAYRTDISQFATFMRDISVCIIGEISVGDLDAWLSSMCQLEAATRCRKIASVSALFDWGRRQGIIAANPVEMMDRPRKVRKDVPVVSLEDFRKLLAVCATPNERGLLAVLFYAGLRRSEAAALTVGAIDIDKREMHVVGKGGHERRVPIVGDLLPLLDDLLRVRGTENSGEPLFLNQWCNPLTPGNVNRWFRRWVKRAGLQAKRYTPHSCRHGLGSILGAEGIPSLAISAILGHRDPKTTDRYVHQSAEQLRRLIDAVDVLNSTQTTGREDTAELTDMMQLLAAMGEELKEALKRVKAA